MSAAPHLIRRRSVVLTGLGVVGLATAGCDDDAGADGPGADGTAQPPDDGDSALVAKVVAQLRSAAALATATGVAMSSLEPATTRLSRLHERHARELGDRGTTATRTANGNRATLMRRLRRTEQRLQRRLTAAALEAESGALAQVFASMAAAVAQQRVELG